MMLQGQEGGNKKAKNSMTASKGPDNACSRNFRHRPVLKLKSISLTLKEIKLNTRPAAEMISLYKPSAVRKNAENIEKEIGLLRNEVVLGTGTES